MAERCDLWLYIQYCRPFFIHQFFSLLCFIFICVFVRAGVRGLFSFDQAHRFAVMVFILFDIKKIDAAAENISF
jgi:hypothetical protein